MGVCDANEKGTSVNCPAGVCVKLDCSLFGITRISRLCGASTKRELAGIDTNSSECQDEV